MLLLAILGFGVLCGAVAQLVLGTGLYRIDWAEVTACGCGRAD